MSRIKFKDKLIDKGISQLVKNVNQKAPMTRVTTGIVTPQDISPGEFVFTSVNAGQEGPSSPTSDESRIYFKDKGGNTFVFTGTKVQ